MTYGHLQADCLYTGISSGPSARYRVRESLYFYLYCSSNTNTCKLLCQQLQLKQRRWQSPGARWRCKSKTGRHNQDQLRHATNHRRTLTRPIFIVATTGLGFATRPGWQHWVHVHRVRRFHTVLGRNSSGESCVQRVNSVLMNGA